MAIVEALLPVLRGWSWTSALFSILGFALVVSLGTRLRQYWRLRHFKGPFLAGFSRLWLVRSTWSGRAYLDFWDVTCKYGSIARVGPNDLITDDPELVKYMYNIRSKFRRSSWYDGMRFDPTRHNLLSLRDEGAHRNLRAKMAAGYSGREVDGLEHKIDENIDRFMALLTKYASSDKALDLGHKVQYFTMDVISDLAFGKPFGFLETDSDVYRYIETTERAFSVVMIAATVPVLVRVLASPLLSVVPSEADKIGFGPVIRLAKKVAAQRFGEKCKVQKDMLGSFVAHGINQSEAESEILLQLIAGSDTTATAIRSTLLHVITNPPILARLHREIEERHPLDSIISDETARSMPYLQAVVKEGLRIFPPVAGVMSKEVPAGGHHWKGTFIPGGTVIGSCAWGIFRRQDIWGADASEFRPERWLDSTGEALRRMEGTLELIFSHGRWQCLGRPIALIELNKVFVQMESKIKELRGILKGSSAAQRAADQREVALQHARVIQHRKDLEAEILDSLVLLSEYPLERPAHPGPDAAARPSPSDVAGFKTHVRLFQPSDYDDLVAERHVNGLCGYALCPRPHRDAGAGGAWRITAAGRIVRREDLERWCSQACARRAMYVKVQLSEAAAWERAGCPDIHIDLLDEARLEGELEGATRQLADMQIEEQARQGREAEAALALERGSARPKVQVALKEKETQMPDIRNLQIADGDGDDHLLVEGYRVGLGESAHR
ncbi:Cytochrome P450 [Cordyceps fumosorosea ARSEF 2679]|uniref:Cytochrome P450 n=1 Tax=Cordyceps fumosorosea (strain ARSEF 2679) TaxID=1081104 RepID=A0A167RM14_CORFA|nr:Cytochrome P450 [Cordyceps fumosorosea ARSEF 2679]OAA58727.1 Cytochrome P450 [Cordyceps fumosorosea ARSEF 2679]